MEIIVGKKYYLPCELVASRSLWWYLQTLFYEWIWNTTKNQTNTLTNGNSSFCQVKYITYWGIIYINIKKKKDWKDQKPFLVDFYLPLPLITWLINWWINACLFVCCFFLLSISRIFNSYVDVTVTSEGIAANSDRCSARMDIEKWEFLSVTLLFLLGTSI